MEAGLARPAPKQPLQVGVRSRTGGGGGRPSCPASSACPCG